jgi:hypothetical protein
MGYYLFLISWKSQRIYPNGKPWRPDVSKRQASPPINAALF